MHLSKLCPTTPLLMGNSGAFDLLFTPIGGDFDFDCLPAPVHFYKRLCMLFKSYCTGACGDLIN